MDLSVEIFAISGILNGVVAMFYGVYVFLNNRRDRIVLPFLLMTLALAVWGFSYWQWLSAENVEIARIWINPLNIGSFFIVVFFYHWVVRLVDAKDKLSIFFLVTSYLVAGVASYFVGTTYIVTSLGPKLYFPYWPSAGPLYTFTITYLYIIVIIHSVYLLFHALRNAKEVNEKVKLRFVIIGTTVAYLGGLTNFPLWFGIPLPPFFNFLAVAFPSVLGYASVRHRLFNFKAVGAELLVFFILSILFLEILRADTTLELMFRSVIFVFVAALSYLLIRSVNKEIKNREKGERIARYLANANARLRELDKQKTEFVSIASHQLRSPIAAIKGYTSLVLEGSYGDVPGHLNMPLKRILESGQRISIMVDDFLNVTRIEQGRMSYDMKPHNVCKLIDDVAQELRVVAEEKKLQLTVVCAEEEDIKIKADEGKIKQIFSNLIDNAIKYTQEGYIEVSVRKIEPEHKVLIQIKDTGIGIDPAEVVNLFQKFNRASNANKTNVLGTGLGLYIAKEILKAHEGWVAVESEGIGKGSTFTVELPSCEEKSYRTDVDESREAHIPTS